jgi:hypothetical protein
MTAILSIGESNFKHNYKSGEAGFSLFFILKYKP